MIVRMVNRTIFSSSFLSSPNKRKKYWGTYRETTYWKE